MQGKTLTPRLRGEVQPPPKAAATGAAEAVLAPGAKRNPDLAFSEAGWETHNKWQKVVRDGRYKLILAQTRTEQRWIGGAGVRFTLYLLFADPGETKNVAAERPQELERLKKDLSLWEKAPRFAAEVDEQGGTCGDQRQMDEETRKLLESLGYL